jgi:hypothetical protein
VVDSQADHRSPDIPAAAAEDSTRPDRVVDLAGIPSSTLITSCGEYSYPQEDNTAAVAAVADRSNLCWT